MPLPLKSPDAFKSLTRLRGESLVAEPARRLAVERIGLACAKVFLHLGHFSPQLVVRHLVEVCARHFGRRHGAAARERHLGRELRSGKHPIGRTANLLQLLEKPLFAARTVKRPVRRPHVDGVPPKRTENRPPQFVAVAHGERRRIRIAVALNRREIAVLARGVLDADVRR